MNDNIENIPFTLLYFTNNGSEWLKETFTVPQNIEHEILYYIVKHYIERTDEQAKKLNKSWQLNGEDVGLTVGVNCSVADIYNKVEYIIDVIETHK